MENAAGAFSKLFSKGSASHQSEGEQVADSSSAHTHDSVDKTVDSKVAPTSDNGKVDETVDTKVAPAVEHKHVKKQHETREQTFVEKERHQDIYHTTIQPLKDTEVLPEHHEHTQETKQRSINKDDGAAKAKAEADRAGLKNTSDQEQTESKTKEKTQVKEHVHYHLHETVQPVIEKGAFSPLHLTFWMWGTSC